MVILHMIYLTITRNHALGTHFIGLQLLRRRLGAVTTPVIKPRPFNNLYRITTTRTAGWPRLPHTLASRRYPYRIICATLYFPKRPSPLRFDVMQRFSQSQCKGHRHFVWLNQSYQINLALNLQFSKDWVVSQAPGGREGTDRVSQLQEKPQGSSMPMDQQETCLLAFRCGSKLSSWTRPLLQTTYLRSQSFLAPPTISLQHRPFPGRLFDSQGKAYNRARCPWRLSEPPCLATTTYHTPSLHQTYYTSRNHTETHWKSRQKMKLKYLSGKDPFVEESPRSLPVFHRRALKNGGGALKIGMNIPFMSEVESDEISALSCSVLSHFICEPLYPRLNLLIGPFYTML